jgi:hypothetical protein
MTNPNDRFRKIVSGEKKIPDSILEKLPKAAQPSPTPAATPTPPPPASRLSGLRLGPAFWTVTGVISLLVNGVLIGVLLVLLQMLGQLQATAGDTGASLLGGLYTNFEKMDRATIVATIPVDAQIPLNITVPVQKTTQIILAEEARISRARVRINTANLDIDAPADVTLPAGTPLMVTLDFALQVQNTVPVHLDVPVRIPLAQTELHEPFVGLQQVVKPFYCLLEPNAQALDGHLVCR